MTEQRSPYGAALTWRVTAKYDVLSGLGRPDTEHLDITPNVVARDALEAADQVIAEIRRTIPAGATVHNLELTVSLVVPGKDKEE